MLPPICGFEFSNRLSQILLLFESSPRSTRMSWEDNLNPLVLTRLVFSSRSFLSAFPLMDSREPWLSSENCSLWCSVNGPTASSKISVLWLDETFFPPPLPPSWLPEALCNCDCLGLGCTKFANSAALTISSITGEGWRLCEDFLDLVYSISSGLVL